MSNEKRIEEKLKQVATIFAGKCNRDNQARLMCVCQSCREYVEHLTVLRRELLPLLLAGQAMRDAAEQTDTLDLLNDFNKAVKAWDVQLKGEGREN